MFPEWSQEAIKGAWQKLNHKRQIEKYVQDLKEREPSDDTEAGSILDEMDELLAKTAAEQGMYLKPSRVHTGGWHRFKLRWSSEDENSLMEWRLTMQDAVECYF